MSATLSANANAANANNAANADKTHNVPNARINRANMTNEEWTAYKIDCILDELHDDEVGRVVAWINGQRAASI
jgi:hypothetical protein